MLATSVEKPWKAIPSLFQRCDLRRRILLEQRRMIFKKKVEHREDRKFVRARRPWKFWSLARMMMTAPLAGQLQWKMFFFFPSVKRKWRLRNGAGLALGLLPSAAQSKRTFAHSTMATRPSLHHPPIPDQLTTEKKGREEEKQQRGNVPGKMRENKKRREDQSAGITVVFERRRRGERKRKSLFPVFAGGGWVVKKRKKEKVLSLSSSSAPTEPSGQTVCLCAAQKQFHD